VLVPQVEEAGPGRNVRDISHPQQIGPIRREVTVDEIGCLACAIPHRRDDSMRKVDGWQTLATKPIDQPIDLAA
jgi:hypothetical protein